MNGQANEDAALILSAVVESSDDAIISKDLNGIIRSWNKSAERLFGYEAAEAVGQSVATFLVSAGSSGGGAGNSLASSKRRACSIPA
jgi:PAS domain-containing protein